MLEGGRVTKGNGLLQVQFIWFISKLTCNECHEFNKCSWFSYFFMSLLPMCGHAAITLSLKFLLSYSSHSFANSKIFASAIF